MMLRSAWFAIFAPPNLHITPLIAALSAYSAHFRYHQGHRILGPAILSGGSLRFIARKCLRQSHPLRVLRKLLLFVVHHVSFHPCYCYRLFLVRLPLIDVKSRVYILPSNGLLDNDTRESRGVFSYTGVTLTWSANF